MGLTGNRLGTDATGLSARALARDRKGGTSAQYETIVEGLGKRRIEDRGTHEGVGHAASPVLRASAMTGDRADASSAPSVTFSASNANSGGHGLSLSWVILPRETLSAAASWLAFMASGRFR